MESSGAASSTNDDTETLWMSKLDTLARTNLEQAIEEDSEQLQFWFEWLSNEVNFRREKSHQDICLKLSSIVMSCYQQPRRVELAGRMLTWFCELFASLCNWVKLQTHLSK
jgi:hypothetical protein